MLSKKKNILLQSSVPKLWEISYCSCSTEKLFQSFTVVCYFKNSLGLSVILLFEPLFLLQYLKKGVERIGFLCAESPWTHKRSEGTGIWHLGSEINVFNTYKTADVWPPSLENRVPNLISKPYTHVICIFKANIIKVIKKIRSCATCVQQKWVQARSLALSR